MSYAMQFTQPGGPEMLQPVTLTLGEPGPGEVRLRHSAIGLNYIDTYHRSGLYTVALPATPGMEAAGVVEAVGEGVTLRVGERVVYGRGPMGAYASARLIAARECVCIPDDVSDEIAASVLLKGLTAWYLLHETFPVRAGDTILVHAAAGGVGIILCQWAKRIGTRVIGTVGSAAKATLALQHGCDEVILYREEPVAQRVRELTGGQGVPVVYDAVGADTFAASLDSLCPRGMLVSYGQASGPIPPFELTELARRGSLYLTRPSLMDYVRDDATYQRAANAVLGAIAKGTITMRVAQKFDLKDAAEAHRQLEARATVGSSVLIP